MRVTVLVLAIIGIAILGCTKASPTSTPLPTPTSTVTPTATPMPSPTSTIAPLPTATITPEPFSLLVTQPQGDSVVNSSPIAVIGSTTPDAVVSINGEAVDVDIQGAFSAQVALEVGPNVIEVVASNLRGDQQSVILALIYLP